MGQAVQIVGSILILIPFGFAQRGWLHTRSRIYLVLNLVGSVVLAFNAGLTAQWGFLLLETVWASVSLAGLLAVMRGRAPHQRR
ncbi:MAG TPA: hypothetical protein VIS06_21645 [Mycobacteriales bacterium]|jgi:hypothetical protein